MEPIPPQVGRPRLTPAQLELRKLRRKVYFKNYYEAHPDKYMKKAKPNKSTVYIISSPDTECVYIGSTVDDLAVRWAAHQVSMKSQVRNLYSAMNVMSDKWSIKPLVECTLPVADLRLLESLWIAAAGSKVLNKHFKDKYTDDEMKELATAAGFQDDILPPKLRKKL